MRPSIARIEFDTLVVVPQGVVDPACLLKRPTAVLVSDRRCCIEFNRTIQFGNRPIVIVHPRESSACTRIHRSQLRWACTQPDANFAIPQRLLPLLEMPVRHSSPPPRLPVCGPDPDGLRVIGHCLFVLLQAVVGECALDPD